jgi:Domain of unknown function (DUF927)
MLDTQEYLAKVLPWPQDGDAPAYINIHWTSTELNRHGKPFWGGRATRSLKEAANTVRWALTLDNVRDIYVCMSSQKEALPRTSKKGHNYLLPQRSQANVVALRSLYMDLDAKGKGKNSYDTLEETLAEFAKFLKAIDLPKPNVIVKSGGGLHVYWTFERSLALPDWQPLAHALAAAAQAVGFKCDTGCTIDAARVLRVPGTFNRKLDVPRPVVLAGGRTGGDYLLARLEQSLGPYKNVARASVKTPPWSGVLPQKQPLLGGNALSAGVDTSGPLTDINDLAAECPFIKEAVTSGGKDFANPLWNLTTLIATFTEGQRNDAHTMACGHATYTRDSTELLFDRKENDHKTKGVGWPACRTIHTSGYAGCAACPHLSAGRTPFHFAAAQSAQASTAAPNASGNPPDDLPVGYVRQGNGIVSKIYIGDDGTQTLEPLCNYPMITPSLQVYPIYTLNFHTITETGKHTQIQIPTGDCSTKDSMRRCLLKQGVALREGHSKNVMEFFMSWIEKLQRTKEMVVSSSPYGWSLDSKSTVEGFVFGGDLHMPNGSSRAASNPDPVLARRYKPTGALNPWVAAAKLITDQKRPALDAIIASSFAAPLIRFCHEPGVVMSTYSGASGLGKTSALKIAQAVWGHPIRAMQGLDDTNNSTLSKIGQIQNLPMYWDELKTDEDTKRFVKLVFSLTRQKEKDRLTQYATMRESGMWQTLLVSASNDSIIDFVTQHTKQTTAGMYRLFEYEVPASSNGLGQIDQADFSKVIGRLDDNYGNVGLEYARYLGSNHAAISSDIEDFYKVIGNEINTTNEERYWRVMLATLLKGAEYANKLNFTNIDIDALKIFLIGVVDNMRVEKIAAPVDLSVSINVSNVLTQFLAAMRFRNTLRTNKIHTGRGKPVKGSISVKTWHTDKLEALRVHVGEDDKLLRISKTFLQDWLRDHDYSPAAIIKAMATEFGAVSLQGRLGGGTEFVSGVEYLLEIDLTKNNHINFLDEA